MKLRKTILVAGGISVVMTSTAFAGTWKNGTGENQGRWWYEKDDGTYAANGWHWIDGNNDGIAESFYFDSDGWMLANTVTPDGCQVNENGQWIVDGIVQTKTMDPSGETNIVYNVWRKGNIANTASEYAGKDYRPWDYEKKHTDDWWYDIYFNRKIRGKANAWRWIDEDKNGNKDGILNLYYFDSYWMVKNQVVDGKQLNEDGAWVVDGVVQTISERRDVKSNTEWCGLRTGVYWDKKHQTRVEILNNKKVRYYDGRNQMIMEGNILDPKTPNDFKNMICYSVEPTFDAVYNADPVEDIERRGTRYVSIFVDSGIDHSGRGYSSYGDISLSNGGKYGVFNREKDAGREHLFSYEEK